MSIIYRSVKGSELTSDEVDGNFQFLSDEKQDNLTFDSTPTNGSLNPVTSGGIYNSISALSSLYLKLDGYNSPITGDIGITAGKKFESTYSGGFSRIAFNPSFLGLESQVNDGAGNFVDIEQNVINYKISFSAGDQFKFSATGLDIKTNSNTVTVNSDLATSDYTAQLPNKTGSQTFAMLSDLSGFVSSAITSLNGLNVASQTFSTGSSGTDFGISSSGSAHTFNLPTASASNRGLLSTTDWSSFNGKQSALGFTPENVANKDTDTSLSSNSDTKYASQKAAKTYTDNTAFINAIIFG